MNEQEGDEGPLKEIPGLSKELYVQICDFSKEEARQLCVEIDALQKRVTSIGQEEKRAASPKALAEFQHVEYQEVLQSIDGLIHKYGSGRPGVVPLHLLKAVVGLNLAMVKANLAEHSQ